MDNSGRHGIRNVMVPMDFSPLSRLALNYGIHLARQFHSHLTLLHVVEMPKELKHPLELRAAKLQREQAERMLPALVASEDQDDLDLRIQIRIGDAAEEIVTAAAEYGADLVTMGTHGRGLLGRWISGSVAQAALRRMAVPVLTVGRSGALPFKRILFATDLAEPVEPGLHAAIDLAQAAGADLVLFHMVDLTLRPYAEGEPAAHATENMVSAARGKLNASAMECRRREVGVEVAVRTGDSAAPAVLQAAEECGADLIVIVVRRKGFVERAVLGSNAERLIREAHLPVLSVPAMAPR